MKRLLHAENPYPCMPEKGAQPRNQITRPPTALTILQLLLESKNTPFLTLYSLITLVNPHHPELR